MKNILLLIFLLSTINSFSQFNEATLYLRDGTTLKGFAKVWTESSRIRFKETKKHKQVLFDYRKVKKIIISEDGQNNQYDYKLVKAKKGSRPKLLKFIEGGKISLYRNMFEQNLGGAPISLKARTFEYYIVKSDADKAHNIGTRSIALGRKSLKKGMLKHFDDCPELITKIKNKEFKNRDILYIVQFYNTNCSK